MTLSLWLQPLGSNSENDSLFIKPDYSLSVHALYEQVAEEMIVEQKQCYLLSAVYHDREIVDGLPSWVPDWSRATITLDTLRIGEGVYISTGPEYGIDVPLVEKSGRAYLRIVGYAVASISYVSPVLQTSAIMARFSKADSMLLTELKNICTNHDDDAILEAMMRHRAYPQQLLASYPEPLFGHPDLYSFFTDISPRVNTNDFIGYQTLVEQFRSSLANLCDGRRLFSFFAEEWYSEESSHLQHRIGSAPAILQGEYKVCILYGGFDFYLLRNDADGSMRLLGTCDIQEYKYESNAALHRMTGRPTHHFEIF
jgi:hypothetical protein